MLKNIHHRQYKCSPAALLLVMFLFGKLFQPFHDNENKCS